jgi:ribosome-associated protein
MNLEGVIGELTFKFSRSGGAGGQHVNKVSSKVLLQWDVALSTAASVEEKAMIFNALANRINKEGILQLECDIDRSQIRNKEIAIDRFKAYSGRRTCASKTRKKPKLRIRVC